MITKIKTILKKHNIYSIHLVFYIISRKWGGMFCRKQRQWITDNFGLVCTGLKFKQQKQQIYLTARRVWHNNASSMNWSTHVFLLQTTRDNLAAVLIIIYIIVLKVYRLWSQFWFIKCRNVQPKVPIPRQPIFFELL